MFQQASEEKMQELKLFLSQLPVLTGQRSCAVRRQAAYCNKSNI